MGMCNGNKPFTAGTHRVSEVYRAEYIDSDCPIIAQGIFQYTVLEYPLIIFGENNAIWNDCRKPPVIF